MKDFFKKTAGKVVIIAAVCACVLVVFLVKTGQDSQNAALAANGSAMEQVRKQAMETATAAIQTPAPAPEKQAGGAAGDAKQSGQAAAETQQGGETQAAGEDAAKNKEEALPIFMEFGADWCPYCEQMKPTIEELKNEYEGKLQFVEVNIDEDPQTAAAFGAYSVPYYVLIDEEGIPTLAFPGATTKEKLQEFIKEGVGVEP